MLKQRKLEEKRRIEKTQDQLRFKHAREAVINKSRGAWKDSECNGEEAGLRLFEDWKSKKQNIQMLAVQQKEAERLQIEETRFRHPLARSNSAPSQTTARDVGERMHGEHARRLQSLQRLREETEASKRRLLQSHAVGASSRCSTPRGGQPRSEQLYELAQFQREKLSKLRKDREDSEMRRLAEVSIGKSGPVDMRRIDFLFKEHVERKQRRALLQLQKANSELLELGQHHLPSSPRAHLPNESIVVQLELLNIDSVLLHKHLHVFRALKEAIASSMSTEASHGIRINSNEIWFSAGSASTAAVAQATVRIPIGVAPEDVYDYLVNKSDTSLIAAVTTSIAAVESQNLICHNDDGILVGGLRVLPPKKRVPLWQRPCPAGQVEEAPAQKPSTPRACAKPEDVVLATVIAAVQARCTVERPVTASELKSLAEPLRAIMCIYKDACTESELLDGHTWLRQLTSTRLYPDGRLLEEIEGWPLCVEPVPILQVSEDLDELLDAAGKAQVKLYQLAAPCCEEPSPEPGNTQWRARTASLALFAINPGPKARAAAQTKAFVRYQPCEGSRCHRHLLDLARMTLVFSNSQLLQKGLDEITQHFEVIHIQNLYNQPSRMGYRSVVVHVYLDVDVGGGVAGSSMPHVCELQLEELCFHRAREAANPHLNDFASRLSALFHDAALDPDAVNHLARWLLASPLESHGVRVFRRQLTKQYGSTVAAWRQSLGNSHQLNFGHFREICQVLKCRENAPEFWAALDPGLAGCISLFELDPDAVTLLLHFRGQVMMHVDSDDIDGDSFFERLCFRLAPATPGQLHDIEFRYLLKGLGINPECANRLFTLLDYHGGSNHHPPARLTVADLLWLKRLPMLVDVSAVTFLPAGRHNNVELMRHMLSQRRNAVARDQRVRSCKGVDTRVSRGKTAGNRQVTNIASPRLCWQSTPRQALTRSRSASFTAQARGSR